jgi:hypothetical protein
MLFDPFHACYWVVCSNLFPICWGEPLRCHKNFGHNFRDPKHFPERRYGQSCEIQDIPITRYAAEWSSRESRRSNKRLERDPRLA